MKYATCHTNRQHYAHGQCKSCYSTQRYGSQNNDRAKRFYHASKVLHDFKGLVPKFIFARKFQNFSRGNYRAYLMYGNMLVIRFKRLHDLGYDKWLDQAIEIYTRNGGSYEITFREVQDTLIKSTNGSSE